MRSGGRSAGYSPREGGERGATVAGLSPGVQGAECVRKQQVHDMGDDDMKKGAGMGGRSAVGHGAARRAQRSERRAGPLRWRALFLAALMLPGAAWGQQTARELLKEKRDHRLWEEAGRCDGAERYLKAFPEGLHAAEARECLAVDLEETRRRMKGYEEGAYKALERGNVAGARRRLEELRRLDGKAPEVMDLEDAIAEAEEKLGTMREYAKTGHEALGRGDLKKARRYVERLRGLDAESSLVVELGEAIAEAERRAQAERERKAREAEERRRAEAERKAREEAKWSEGPPGSTFRDCPECPEMVVVPAGRFQMGSPESEADRYDAEGPVHRVTFERPFAVGVHEVTRGEFARFVSEKGRAMGNACWTYEGGEWKERSGRHWKSPGFSQTDGHPVGCVSWDDAKAYVGWLSGETGEEYRLLSEAEWEYVARAGTETARYWGESERGQCRYANGADRTAKRHNSGWTTVDCDDGHYRTAPVGSYEANGFGLHDVLGNVWEWTEDCWNGSYWGAPRDGSAWTSGDCYRRVLRGGSWNYVPWFLRSADRVRGTTGIRFDDYSFRVARTLTP